MSPIETILNVVITDVSVIRDAKINGDANDRNN